MKILKHKYHRYFLMAICLVLCLGMITFLVSRYISGLAVDSCFQKLENSTRQLAREIRQNTESDTKLLELTASYIADEDKIDSGESLELLTAAKSGSMMDGAGLILPDGRIFANDEAYLTNLRSISYEEELKKGPHMSKRSADSSDPDRWFLYNFIPLVEDGETKGLLCGIIDLEKQRQQYQEIFQDDTTRFHLIDSTSGDFLIDLSHDELGNALHYAYRKVDDGYSAEQAFDDVAAGRTGRASFYSQTLKEFVYCVYEPVGVNDWVAILGQPKSVAFREASDVRAALYHFAALEFAVFVCYLLVILLWIRKASNEREKEFDRIQYILDIEEILFNAPRDPELIKKALQEVARKHTAEKAVFVRRDRQVNEKVYIWEEDDREMKEYYLEGDFPFLHKKLLQDGYILSFDMKKLTQDAPKEYELLKQIGVENIMMIPVKEPDESLIGSLGVLNMRGRFHSTELLECVMLSFSMTVKNLESYQAIEEMGLKDRLTGLKNRNCFQNAMEYYEKSPDNMLSCIYMDADGLHELNNNYGHDAGDQLLKTVAGEVLSEFGEAESFRVGGDEFVIFCHGYDHKSLEERISKVEKAVAEEGYHISTGVECRSKVPLVCEMVKCAEAKMYEAKQKYHEEKGDEEQLRIRNFKLEEMLMEKRDLEIFRMVLTEKYLGVYIVDLQLDAFRSIYIPDYFAEVAEESGGKFSVSLQSYAQQFVRPEYRDSFLQLLDYNNVEKYLDREEEPVFLYERTDGMRLLLKIYRSPEYSQQRKESIWTFEREDS